MLSVKVLTAEQKGVKLYIGVLPAKELLKRAQVDYWTPANSDGYQRQLVPKRVTEGAWYLMEGEAVFPTSILVSIRGSAEFREEARLDGIAIGTLEVGDDQPLWVIDGQHRKAMLEEAIRRGERDLEEYQIPVTIFLAPDKFEEMRTFYLVNSRAKSVPTDIADRLLQRAFKERGKLWLQEKESPQERKAEKAVLQARATNLVDYLRENCRVWQNMVEVPGEERPSRNAVRQHMLVSSLLEGPFKDASITRLDDKSIGQLSDRYWSALVQVFPEAFEEPENYSIQRTPGVYSLHMVFPDVFERCREVRDYTQEKMTEMLQTMALDSTFWHKDPNIGDFRTHGTGMKSLRLLADFLRDQLPRLSLAGL